MLESKSLLVDKLFEENISFFKKESNLKYDNFDSFVIIFAQDIFPKIVFLFVVMLYTWLNKDLAALRWKYKAISFFIDNFFQIFELEKLWNLSKKKVEKNHAQKKAIVDTTRYMLADLFNYEIKPIYYVPDIKEDQMRKEFLDINIKFFIDALESIKGWK